MRLIVTNEVTKYHLIVYLVTDVFKWAVSGSALHVFNCEGGGLVEVRTFIVWRFHVRHVSILQLKRLMRNLLLGLAYVALSSFPCLSLFEIKKHSRLVGVAKLGRRSHLLNPSQADPIVNDLSLRCFSLGNSWLVYLNSIIIRSLGLEAPHEDGLLAGANVQGLAVVSASASCPRPLGAVFLLRDAALLWIKVVRLGNLGGLDSILQSLSQRRSGLVLETGAPHLGQVEHRVTLLFQLLLLHVLKGSLVAHVNAWTVSVERDIAGIVQRLVYPGGLVVSLKTVIVWLIAQALIDNIPSSLLIHHSEGVHLGRLWKIRFLLGQIYPRCFPLLRSPYFKGALMEAVVDFDGVEKIVIHLFVLSVNSLTLGHS